MDKIYITADPHGNYLHLRNILTNSNISIINSTMIILGDFGANFYLDKRDEKFKSKLEKFASTYNINYFIIRGNHEQRPSLIYAQYPNLWSTEKFWNGMIMYENKFPHIKYATDYPSIYEIPIENKIFQTLVLPGAYSVDKYYRLSNHWSWFSEEQCNTKEQEIALKIIENQKDWNLILSHTCPISYEPTDLFLPMIDQTTVDKTTERWLQKIQNNINYDLWAWGHFHENRIYPTQENKNHIMLYNNCVFDLTKFYNNTLIEKCFIKTFDTAKINNLN